MFEYSPYPKFSHYLKKYFFFFSCLRYLDVTCFPFLSTCTVHTFSFNILNRLYTTLRTSIIFHLQKSHLLSNIYIYISGHLLPYIKPSKKLDLISLVLPRRIIHSLGCHVFFVEHHYIFLKRKKVEMSIMEIWIPERN